MRVLIVSAVVALVTAQPQNSPLTRGGIPHGVVRYDGGKLVVFAPPLYQDGRVRNVLEVTLTTSAGTVPSTESGTVAQRFTPKGGPAVEGKGVVAAFPQQKDSVTVRIRYDAEVTGQTGKTRPCTICAIDVPR